MGTRHPNHRRVKLRQTYTFEELAQLFHLHENTVRSWRKLGLEPIDKVRPILFRGDVVVAFLQHRKASAKQPCGPGQLYCLRCRKPQEPAGGMLDYAPATPTAGSLAGLCPVCDRMMFRRVSRHRVQAVAGGCDVQFRDEQPRLTA